MKTYLKNFSIVLAVLLIFEFTFCYAANAQTSISGKSAAKVTVKNPKRGVVTKHVLLADSEPSGVNAETTPSGIEVAGGTSPVTDSKQTIKVQMFNANTSADNNTIFPRYKIYNTGNTPISLSDIKVRYYYTIDGEKEQNFWCDWSDAGSSNVTGTFVKMSDKQKGADTYVEIGFKTEAGVLDPGKSVEIQCRVAKTDWSNYNQGDDYSFNNTSSDYTEWNNSTGYISSELKWGNEPGTENPADTNPPTVPQNLSSYSISDSTITLTWAASADDTGVSGYIIYRDGSEIARVDSGTSFTDSGMSPNNVYKYEVAAYDYAKNVSGKSPAVSTKTGENVNSAIRVQLYNANKAVDNNTIFPWYKIYNSGNVPVNLEDIKVRYYYTIDGEKPQNFWCDWSNIGSSNVVGNFIKMPAVVDGVDYCLEISFKSGSGILKPGDSAELQCRIAKNEWTNYNQANDYSFNSISPSYVDWTKVTGYLKGELAWGVEPVAAPKNIRVSPASNEIALSWDSVPCATSYEIEADGKITETTDNSFTYSGLIPGTKHIYRIRAKNSIMTSPWSEYLTSFTLFDKPSNITKEVTDSQIKLSWDAVEGAVSYEMEVDGQTVNNGLETSYVLDNPDAGTLHTVKIRAKGADIDGEWTDLMQIWTLPDVPSNIHAAQTSSTITLSWDSVTGASAYDVEVYGKAEDIGNNTSYTLSGLEPNTQRTFRVRAKNSSGVSPWSNVIAAGTLPGSSFNVQITSTDNSLKVTWDEQAGATGYEVEIDGAKIVEVSGNSYTHTGLGSNTEHTYRVRAKNADGYSEWSPLAKGITTPFIPADFKVSQVGSSLIKLEWDKVDGATGYDIEADGKIIDNALNTTYLHDSLNPNSEHTYRVRARNGNNVGAWTNEITQSTLLPAPANFKAEVNGSDIKLVWDMVVGAESYELEIDGAIVETGTSTEYIKTGLNPGVTHTFRVRAKNSIGSGEWSSMVTQSGALGKPLNVKTTSQSDSITISWDSVEGAEAYDVMVDGTIMDAGSSTSYVHKNLKPNTLHTYMVRAKNSAGPGEWSSTVSAFTGLGIPSNIRISASSTSITVTWDDVDGADSYDIMVDGRLVENITNTAYTHSGLWPNTSHTYKIRAKNKDCTGEWSSQHSQLTGPAVPANIKAFPDLNQIKLTWDNPAGAVSYEVEADGETIEDISALSYIQKNLEPNTTHEYRIRAKNSEGVCSEWSDLLKVNTTDEMIINVERDTGFNFVISLPKKENVSSYDIVVNYNPADVEIVDLYASTQKPDLETGKIEGSALTVKELSDGKIMYHVDSSDKAILAIIKFMSKVTGKTSMSYKVE
ncbi:MAG TPA: cellulose binding domain-containing protein [Ruminiclostridium sp.]|nr:cellulose binding domain-containing protein [Ruminiclostridium sp.]